MVAELAPAALHGLGGFREWQLRRVLKEAYFDLRAALEREGHDADRGAVRRHMSRNLTSVQAGCGNRELRIGHQQVMQCWERPYMAAMAEVIGGTGGDVLEVGFGMGILATLIQERGVRSHTIIECHPDVLTSCTQWSAQYAGRAIRIVAGRWQDVIGSLGSFDAIAFDAYPLDESEWTAHYVDDVTYARHFFATASAHVRPGGVFTYYSNECDSLSRSHQRALLEHFSKVSIGRTDGLSPPADCHYWQSDSMVVIAAVK
ncbi:MAG: hypothetical protein ACK4V1_03580 [Burkholderiaceae bacterium]